MGDGKKTLAKAWRRLGGEDGVALSTLSSPFLTDPVGMDSTNTFTNCVGRIETSLSPGELLTRLLNIEQEFGRTRTSVDGQPEDRILDLDLLYYNAMTINADNLVLPHPRISERLFVLAPMVEIEPTCVDPMTGEDVVSMCRRLFDQLRDGTIAEQKIERSTWDAGLFDADEDELFKDSIIFGLHNDTT